MIALIDASHGELATKRAQRRTARLLFRSLLTAGVIVLEPRGDGRRGKVARLSGELQREFSLNQTLSLYLVETLDRLDPESETYALDVLTLVESTMEDPTAILLRQLDRLKTEKLAELKAAGVEYEERVAELEKLEHPKPLRDFVYATFNAFEAQHPWVGHENIRPKSVARDMFERYGSFDDYVREYDLHRSEGLLLRYLSDVYKALVQSVPEPNKDAEVDAIVVYLRDLIRGVDSSLVDEWESLRDGGAGATPAPRVGEAPRTLADDPRALAVRVRNEMYRLLRALAHKRYDEAAANVRAGAGEPAWTPARIEAAMAPYWADYGEIRLDPAARSPGHTALAPRGAREWSVQQTIVDPEGDHLWVVEGTVDLGDGTGEGTPLIELRGIHG
jgi:hypothetical protein